MDYMDREGIKPATKTIDLKAKMEEMKKIDEG